MDVALTISPVRAIDGTVIGASTLARDVTRRKQEELALREARAATERSLARLVAVVSSMVDGLITAEPGGNLLEWNPAALRMHGYDSLEEARRHLSEFTKTFVLSRPGGEPLAFSDWPMVRVLRGETVVDSELHLRRLDVGRDWLINYSGGPVLGSDGAVQLGVLNLHDVTERRRAEAQRDVLLRRLRLQVERLPLGYVLMDADLRVVEWNPAAEAIFGYSREEVLGMAPALRANRPRVRPAPGGGSPAPGRGRRPWPPTRSTRT